MSTWLKYEISADLYPGDNLHFHSSGEVVLDWGLGRWHEQRDVLLKCRWFPVLRKLIAWIVTLLAMGFFLQRLIANIGGLPQISWGVTTCGVAFASVALGLVAIWASAGIWQVLLRDQSIGNPWAQIQSLFMVAQFGKYLPGNVGQFVGRIVLAKEVGIPVPVTLTTMLTEILWGVGTALGISALALLLFLGQRQAGLPPWADSMGMALCFLGLLSAPWLAIALIRRFFPRFVARWSGEHEITAPGLRAALLVSCLFTICFVAMGLILQLQSRFLFGAASFPLLQVSGFFALAWLAGYILPGAPAGLGVRESMMIVLFAPLFGENVALALGITLRLATTLADAIAFLIGWGWRSALLRMFQQ